MKYHKGYYSLIQFCPDVSRLESVNLGVILFCPSLKFLNAKTSNNTKRAKALFGKADFALKALKLAKSSIEQRLQVDASSFRTIEDLNQFVNTRANSLKLTPPRPIKVTSPEKELTQLFEELVERKPSHGSSESEKQFPELKTLFMKLKRDGRAQLNYKFRLPILEQEIMVPYAYNNGKQNLVKPNRFTASLAPQQALRLAMQGDLISKHRKNSLVDTQKSQLIVVSSFEKQCRPDLVEHVDSLFKEYSVRHIAQSNVGDFVKEVEKEAHTV